MFEEAMNFGTEAKIALVKEGMTQRELARRVSEQTGLYIDDAVISRVLSGANKNEKLIASVRSILGLHEMAAGE